MIGSALSWPLVLQRYHHCRRFRTNRLLCLKSSSQTTKPVKPLNVERTPLDTHPDTATASAESVYTEMTTLVSTIRSNASPELLAISIVYFVQGFLALSTLALSYFLKDDLMQGPAQVAFYEGFIGLPWVIKPLYGFASDSFPLFGYRRRSYLILCGLVGSSAWLLLGTAVMSPWGTVAMMVLSSAGTACSDVVVDSLVVERARGEPQETSGSLQTLCWGSLAVGGIFSSYFGGYFVQTFGPRFVFKAISVFPLLVLLSAFLIKDSRITTPTPISTEKSNTLKTFEKDWTAAIRSQLSLLWSAFKQKNIYLPAMFIFLYNATPSAGSAMFFFQTNVLNFSPEFMGRVALIGQSVPLKTLFKWSCIVGTILGMSQLVLTTRLNTQIGLSDKLFVLGDSAVLRAIGQVAFMPTLVLAARLCPEGVEATLFALLMSICNGGGMTGGLLGAGLTQMFGVTEKDFTNLTLLIGICVFSNLLPLAVVNLLPDQDENSETVGHLE